MKKNIIAVLILVLALVFSGCSSAEKHSDDITTNSTASTIAESSTTKDSLKASSDIKSSAVGGSTESSTSASVKDGAKSESSASPAESVIESPAYEETYRDGDILMESKVYMDGLADESADSYLGASELYSPVAHDDEDVIYEPIEIEPVTRPQVKAGTLTAGEWNDNRNYDFLKTLLSDGQNYNYKDFFTKWELSPFNRLVVRITDGQGTAIQGAKVIVSDPSGNSIYSGVTDHTGTAYAYYALLDADMMPASVDAEYNGVSVKYDVKNEDMLDTSVINLTIDAEKKAKTLDLMFTVDTTGSMGDEIYYLQSELQDVIKRVENDTANIPLRLSVNFYRDHGDNYVVRPYEFSENINEQLAYLNKEYANGGGDFEEAVELALESSVKDHAWNEDSIKLLFLVLDAPPHNTSEIRNSLKETIAKASELGIRIIPVASSGIDKDTEFILRAFAMTTGGTYTFLTDDSGVGGSHIEPTVGEYKVEQLNDMLVRIIEEYIG